MRVLLVSRNYFPANIYGGAQVSVAQMAKGLQELGHEVAVLNVDSFAHTGMHEETSVFEYRLKLRNLYTQGQQSVPKRLAWHVIDRLGTAMMGDYRRVFDDFRPDIVNTHVMAGIGTSLWRVATEKGVPIVHRVSDYYLLCLNSGHRKGDENCQGVCGSCRILALSQSRRYTPLVNHVIFVSEKIHSIYDEASVWPQQTPHTVIHGAYRPAKPLPARPDLIDGNCLSLGFFGRLSPEKGLSEILSTLREMPNRNWKLLVGGDGPADFVNALKAQAADLPIEFVGRQSPDDFYAKVDALIVSSLWDEPSGRVAFESGIHGTIPIVSNRGGLPEMVAFGERGLVFDPVQPETLREAILRTMADASFREQVRRRWEIDKNTYEPINVAKQTLGIYEGVLEQQLYRRAVA